MLASVTVADVGGGQVPDVGGQLPDVGGGQLPDVDEKLPDVDDNLPDVGGQLPDVGGNQGAPPPASDGGGATTTPSPGGTTTTPPETTTTPPSDSATVVGEDALEGGGGNGKDKGKGKSKDKGKDTGKGTGGANGDGSVKPPPIRNPNGTPTKDNPGLSVAEFGPSPIQGIPNFMINQFEIPPFMLPIYQACGTQYGVPWPVLASIHKIESAFGTNMGPSTAGAIGQMQFLPSSWEAYGVDANRDGRKDPYNPLDAVCAAGNYLNAAGAEEDLRTAIFAYNHADWYVDEVLLVARQYGRLPDDLIGSLTGLTEGAHFPVAAKATYADDLSERAILEHAKPAQRTELGGVTADTISSSPTRRGINIFSRQGAPVVAVNDGAVKQIGHSKRLGDYLVLQDSYGNRFTYAQLDAVSKVYPVPKQRKLNSEDFEIAGTKKEPDHPASTKGTAEKESAGERGSASGGGRANGDGGDASGRGGGGGESPSGDGGDGNGRRANASGRDGKDGGGPVNSEDLRPRLYAYPERPRNVDRADVTGQLDPMLGERLPGYETVKAYLGGVLKYDRRETELRRLEEGSQVVAGTVLGRIGKTDDLAPHVNFAIKPAGKGAKRIDPKPILDGWKLLESTAIYRAEGKSPFNEADVSQVLLMSKPELERHVLDDSRIQIYACGRQDVQTHQIDARVLRTLAVLSAKGFRLMITSLKCGHSIYTTSGSISHHSSGNAVDIAMINGQPILGNQGPGSITETVIQELLEMQEPNQCDQIISLMDMGGPTLSMSDHADHIHCGFTPEYGTAKTGQQLEAVLKPKQWSRLLDRIGEIDEPKVPRNPSKYSLPTGTRKGGASGLHKGE
jgi:murein DD-endopeptidase MepM/ murein hydrolase activator NlpD